MEILLVRGQVRPERREAFNDAAARYNGARESAGLPTYRRMIDTSPGADGELVFMCEFSDTAEMDRVDELLETDPVLKQAIAELYEHLVPGSVSTVTLRDVE